MNFQQRSISIGLQTTHLPTVCASWWTSLNVSRGPGLGSRVSTKRGPVSGGATGDGTGVALLQRSPILGGGLGFRACMMRSNASWIIFTWDLLLVDRMTNWWTDTIENITFLQLWWREEIIFSSVTSGCSICDVNSWFAIAFRDMKKP